MSKAKITLQTTEVIEGVKFSPGAEVHLDENDPIAVKTREMEKAVRAEARAEAKSEKPHTPETPKPAG